MIEEFKDELAGHTISKGTVQFPMDKPLPADAYQEAGESAFEIWLKANSDSRGLRLLCTRDPRYGLGYSGVDSASGGKSSGCSLSRLAASARRRAAAPIKLTTSRDLNGLAGHINALRI